MANATSSPRSNNSFHLSKDEIRRRFAARLSEMYGKAAPLYKKMVEVVEAVNHDHIQKHPEDSFGGDLKRVTQERHGAIRLGKPEEMHQIADFFDALGMYPVGFYDLTALPEKPLPILGTAFRPIERDALEHNPFRMFTSLLQLEDDRFFTPALREKAKAQIKHRQIFSAKGRKLIEKNKKAGGLNEADANALIEEGIKALSMSATPIPKELYEELKSAGSDIAADIVCFDGTHINHLTPRVLDIWELYRRMKDELNIAMIDQIQGPEMKDGAVVDLRQTSYKAVPISVQFIDSKGIISQGEHRAPFGEIEQRGVALTHKGRAKLEGIDPQEAWKHLPKTYAELEREGLAYFEYHPTKRGLAVTAKTLPTQLSELVKQGYLEAVPIVYEDFLAASAAGIFKSNLSDDGRDVAAKIEARNFSLLQEAVGREIKDTHTLYEAQRKASIDSCYTQLGIRVLCP